ncbi:anti-lipopolysaccharide factor-like [Montipora foliosa]|uniref:anti-lipopolysaccharide factor-like n=1 Tax=Montipora foliosa TaxID=591990 RepID=UPI0035F10E23
MQFKQMFVTAVCVLFLFKEGEMNIIKDLATLYSTLQAVTGESGQLNYQGHVISYKAEGRIHKLKWVYDGTAWDVGSGTSVKAKHYKSKQGAIEHAVKKLIDELKTRGIRAEL